MTSAAEEKQARHTPGPWNDGRDVYLSGCHGANLNLGFINTHDDDLRAQAEANARLIAAAPDLLEACRALRFALKLAALKFDFSLDGSESMELADAAISLATAPKVK